MGKKGRKKRTKGELKSTSRNYCIRYRSAGVPPRREGQGDRKRLKNRGIRDGGGSISREGRIL